MSSAPVLIVISGPAGSGKSTLCDRLVRECPEFSRVVTTTTRPPREGEVNGVHYHFFSPAEFRARIDRGDFLEWAQVHGNNDDRLYGTLKASVVDPLTAGRSLVMSIDVQGVANLRRFQANAQSPVFNELVAITRKTMGAEPLIREALQPLKKELKSAWIFGSVAKQTDKAGSDIDVMLVGDHLRMEKVLKLLLPLEDQLGRKISPTCYTKAEFARRRAEPDSFVNRVLSQPVIPLLGEALEPARAR